MSDVQLDIINDGQNGTAIEAQGERYADDFVFRADASTADVVHLIHGLRGVGINEGDGVFGSGGEGGAGVRGHGGAALQRGKFRGAPAGVIGRGGRIRRSSGEAPGAGVIGVGTGDENPDPRKSSGAGVFGMGATEVTPRSQVGGTGVVGSGSRANKKGGQTGAGVVGVSAELVFPSAETTANVGVYGTSSTGPGVVGVAAGGVSTEERGAPGVIGTSGSGPGGEFSCSLGGQVRLVPSKDGALPTIGRRGDLWVHRRRGRTSRIRQPGVSLYICVQDSPTVQWQLVLLDPTRVKGGTVVP